MTFVLLEMSCQQEWSSERYRTDVAHVQRIRSLVQLVARKYVTDDALLAIEEPVARFTLGNRQEHFFGILAVLFANFCLDIDHHRFLDLFALRDNLIVYRSTVHRKGVVCLELTSAGLALQRGFPMGEFHMAIERKFAGQSGVTQFTPEGLFVHVTAHVLP